MKECYYYGTKNAVYTMKSKIMQPSQAIYVRIDRCANANHGYVRIIEELKEDWD